MNVGNSGSACITKSVRETNEVGKGSLNGKAFETRVENKNKQRSLREFWRSRAERGAGLYSALGLFN